MSEDHDALLSKIGMLAGQINRHKNQQEQSRRPPVSDAYSQRGGSSYHARGRGHSYWPPPRARGRGGRTIPVTHHHHKTLVINNNPSVNSNAQNTQLSTGLQESSGSESGKPPEGWVAKRDRHMQLINTNVYEQQVKSRAKAIAKTSEDRLKRRNAREQIRLKRFLECSHNQSYGQGSNHEIMIGGEKYRVAANGSKLILLSGTQTINQTPKKAVVGGVTFTRSKNGNLWRTGLVRASRSRTQRKVNEPCKFYSTTGKCKNGMSCPYIHNPDQVAICSRFLTSDSCPDGDLCDLSHDPTPHRVPACHHFLRGSCSNAKCRYAHVRVNPAAIICRAFAALGYCSKGEHCKDRHVHECPEFDEKGTCTDPKCKLPHIERAGRRRAAAAAANASANAPKQRTTIDASDNSSNEEEEDDDDDELVDSDDVDSELEFDFLGMHAETDGDDDARMQSDYIKF